MAGIYLHIPFCRQKCHYCNFFSVASFKNKDRFVEALISEIRLRKDYLEGEEIGTVYFGGGTPSLLSEVEINRICHEIKMYHTVSPNAEITLEANPDDLTSGWLQNLVLTPVNRLSIGVQSFHDADLHYLNRIHTGSEAFTAIHRAQDSGFENISIDLIYGIPTLSDKNWIHNLESFLSLSVPHLSAYALTVEPKTALHLFIEKKQKQPVSEGKIAGQFQILMALMEDSGFMHYEISNFCRDENFSRHNKGYWSGMKYLGLGPAAHSYNGNSRQWNPSNLVKYIEALEHSEPEQESEILTTENKYNEYILTSLRTIWGTDLGYIGTAFGNDYLKHVLSRAAKYLENETVIKSRNILKLTGKGKLFADGIAADLFM